MNSSRNKKNTPAFLLAPDVKQTILAELSQDGLRRLAYTAYGSQTPQVDGGHLGFNGQLRERPIGWYHLGNGHRVYNPVLMRFHSPDRLSPFGKGGLNAYAYCGGDPVNFTDPTGRFIQYILPVSTFAAHGVSFTYFGIQWPYTSAGLPRYASVATMTGNVVGIAGAAMTLAGVPGVEFVSTAANTLTAAAGVTRTYAAQTQRTQRLANAPGRVQDVDLRDISVVSSQTDTVRRRARASPRPSASPERTASPEIIGPPASRSGELTTVGRSIRGNESFYRDTNGTVYVEGLDGDTIPVRPWAIQ